MYSTQDPVAPVTARGLRKRKGQGEKIVALTAYDATFAGVLDTAGVDVVLVGDSLGNVIQGHATTLPVTLEHMLYHCSAVARRIRRALLIADMPFASYPEPAIAHQNAARLMSEAGAAMVKLEGADHVLDSIRYLSERDIPVCAHLGLTPQSVHKLGGYRVQAREHDAAAKLKADARAAQDAGADLLVLEMVPAALASEITTVLEIPTIGIGAGAGCDGQVLVTYDLIGITPGKRPRFTRDFLVGRGSIADAVVAFRDAVRDGSFPNEAESY